MNRAGLFPATLEAISHPRQNRLEIEAVDGTGGERGDTKMLVLMNLIWRHLAYTMLAGMRSQLVRQ